MEKALKLKAFGGSKKATCAWLQSCSSKEILWFSFFRGVICKDLLVSTFLDGSFWLNSSLILYLISLTFSPCVLIGDNDVATSFYFQNCSLFASTALRDVYY
eukprot:TRINITY_DN15582_c0_g2_i1.p1 TRINITY_DN15582_c0_g2~~TRINITY_DN15582_c0_g2_i1.p1  ORF type:complete len:113 (-),score=13.14 TRINITY_DN15582_c0_g2_i1:389-694(-)